MSELKPCPFCGGEAKIVKSPENEYIAICRNKQCNASVGFFPNTRKEAIEAWNRRADDEIHG